MSTYVYTSAVLNSGAASAFIDGGLETVSSGDVDIFMIESSDGSPFTGTIVNGQAQYPAVGYRPAQWSFKG
jgi:hypothetical protein